MRGLFEFLKVLSVIVALGAASWAGFLVLASSPEVGVPSYDISGPLKVCGLVFVVAIIVNLISSRMTRKPDF